jgi:hypothetical protein
MAQGSSPAASRLEFVVTLLTCARAGVIVAPLGPKFPHAGRA